MRAACQTAPGQVIGFRESEAGVQSRSEKAVEGRVYGVVEARDLRPIGSSANKSVARPSPAFSAVDFGNAFPSASGGACVRGFFPPPLVAPAAPAAAAAARAPSAARAVADTHGGSRICVRLGDGELVELLLRALLPAQMGTNRRRRCFRTARHRLRGGGEFA